MKRKNALMLGVLAMAGIVSSVAILARKTTHKQAIKLKKMEQQRVE